MSSTSSTNLNAMAADPPRLSYFSLPGEIRNKIMGYVLVPGDVYLDKNRPVPKTSTGDPETTSNATSTIGPETTSNASSTGSPETTSNASSTGSPETTSNATSTGETTFDAKPRTGIHLLATCKHACRKIRNKMMGHLLDSGDVYSNRLVPEASTHSRGTTVKTRSKSGIRQTTTCKQACSRIRNKIRGYALKPEDIHPSRPASETSTDKIETTPRTGSRADIQLLVTCKQAYNEGHELFYSSNTFHLPPVETFSWSDRLAPKYKAMIKRISITIGLVELTPAMLTDIENRMPASVNHNDPDRCARYIVDILVRSWHSKLKTIADWDTLEEIELRSFGRTYLFPHREVAAVWKQCALVYGTGRFADILERSFFYDYLNISVKVILEGWQMTKKWLGEREPGEMAEPFIIGTAEPGGILDQLGFYTR